MGGICGFQGFTDLVEALENPPNGPSAARYNMPSVPKTADATHPVRCLIKPRLGELSFEDTNLSQARRKNLTL
jgi:hypothetical protein